MLSTSYCTNTHTLRRQGKKCFGIKINEVSYFIIFDVIIVVKINHFYNICFDVTIKLYQRPIIYNILADAFFHKYRIHIMFVRNVTKQF